MNAIFLFAFFATCTTSLTRRFFGLQQEVKIVVLLFM